MCVLLTYEDDTNSAYLFNNESDCKDKMYITYFNIDSLIYTICLTLRSS